MNELEHLILGKRGFYYFYLGDTGYGYYSTRARALKHLRKLLR